MISIVVNAAIFCLGVLWAVRRDQKIWRGLSWTIVFVEANFIFSSDFAIDLQKLPSYRTLRD